MSGETGRRKNDPLGIVGKTWDRDTVLVKQFLGAGGAGVFYRAQPRPVMIARNMVLQGDAPVRLFGISDIPSTGKPITDPTHIERIDSAATLYHADYENMKKVVTSLTALRRLEEENLRRYHIDFRGTDVGLKILVRRPEDDDELWADKKARFQREIEVLRNLNHPNIVRCIHDGLEPERDLPYVLMELVENAMPLTLPNRGPLHPKAAIKIGIGMFRALDHAHSRPDGAVLHRDLKPGNVMVDTSSLLLGAGGHATDGFSIADSPDVRLTDWGLAWIEDPEAKSLTKTGQLFGTPAYMSPWQARSSKHPEPAWDVWSGAATLFNLLTGQAPYTGETSGEIFYKVCSSMPPAVREINPAVHPQLAEVIERAFRKNPAHVPSAREFLHGLEEIDAAGLYHTPDVSTGGPREEDTATTRATAREIKSLDRGRATPPQDLRRISRLHDALLAALPKEPARRIPALKQALKFHQRTREADKIAILQKDLAYYRSGADQDPPTDTAAPGRAARALRTAMVAAGIAALIGIPAWLGINAHFRDQEVRKELQRATYLIDGGQHSEAREILKTISDEDYRDERRALAGRCYERARELLTGGDETERSDSFVTEAVDLFETGLLLDPEGKPAELEPVIGKYRQQRQLLKDFILPGQVAARKQFADLREAIAKDAYPDAAQIEALEKDVYRLVDMLQVNVDARTTGGAKAKEDLLKTLRTLLADAGRLPKEMSLRRLDRARMILAEHEKLLGTDFAADFIARTGRVREAMLKIGELKKLIVKDHVGETAIAELDPESLGLKLAAVQQAALAASVDSLEKEVAAIDVTDAKARAGAMAVRARLTTALANAAVATPVPDGVDAARLKGLDTELARIEARIEEYARIGKLLADPASRPRGREALLRFHIDESARLEAVLSEIPEAERTDRMKAFARYLELRSTIEKQDPADEAATRKLRELKVSLLSPSPQPADPPAAPDGTVAPR